MYCSIENKTLGKDIDTYFSQKTRNMIGYLVETPEFNSWFGQGVKHEDGTPILSNFSFTNDKGEKRTVFDFGDIGFSSSTEASKAISSQPCISQWRGSSFVDNVEQGIQMAAILNYYYPNIVYLDKIGEGSGALMVRVNADVVNDVHNKPLLSYYEVEKNVVPLYDYATQATSISQIKKLDGLINQYQGNPQEAVDADKPDASLLNKKVYERVTDFVHAINPLITIQEIDNLGVNGIASINQFLIQVDNENKYRALPEEAAHFLFSFLPQQSELRDEMLRQITSYPIYGQTYETYKNLPEYQNEDGTVNFNKIKQEAVGKLIGQYVNGMSISDLEKIEQLEKVNKSFLRVWWDKFVSFIRNTLNISRAERVDIFRQAALSILRKDVSILDLDQVVENMEKGVYFQVNDKIDIFNMSREIITKVNEHDNTQRLYGVLESFRKDIGNVMNKTVSEKASQLLKEQLEKDENNEPTVNFLTSVTDALSQFRASVTDVEKMHDANNAISNFSGLIKLINEFGRVGDSINAIIKEADKLGNVVDSIVFLQSFKSTYNGFVRFIGSDMVDVLSDSEVGQDMIDSLTAPVQQFVNLDNKLDNKIRKLLASFINDLQSDTISHAMAELNADEERERAKPNPNQTYLKEIADKRKRFYSDEGIVEATLKGLGGDMDLLSQLSHYMLAAVKNADPYVSSIAQYIVKQRKAAQLLAQNEAAAFTAEYDRIMKEGGMNNVYEAGDRLTYIDTILDHDKEGNPTKRQIVKVINPHGNGIEYDKGVLKHNMNKAYVALRGSDKNSEQYTILKQDYNDKRKAYYDFLENHYNSKYTQDYLSFQKKWREDDDFQEYKMEWDALTTEINMRRDELNTLDFTSFDEREMVLQQIIDLKAERAKLLKEEGENAENAKMLKQYFEEGQKFRDIDHGRTERNVLIQKMAYQNSVTRAMSLINKQLQHFSNETDGWNFIETTFQKELKDISFKIKYLYQQRAAELNDSDNAGFHEGIPMNREDTRLLEAVAMQKFEDGTWVNVKTDKFYESIKNKMDNLKILKQKMGERSFEVNGKQYSYAYVENMIGKMYQDIFDILTDRNDMYGQRNPENLKPEERERVNDIESKIDLLKKINSSVYPGVNDQNYQLLAKQYILLIEQFINSHPYYDEQTPIPDTLISTVSDLRQETKRIKHLIPEEDMDYAQAVRMMYDELANLQEKSPTEYYWGKMEEMLYYFQDYINDRIRGGEKDNVVNTLHQNFKVFRDAVMNRNDQVVQNVLNDLWDDVYLQPKVGYSFITSFRDYMHNSDDVFKTDFDQWFGEAHKQGTKVIKDESPEGRDAYQRVEYARRMMYNYNSPRIGEDGEPVNPEHVDKKRNKQYISTKVKQDYLRNRVDWKDTDDMEQWNVSNTGEWLPMSRSQLQEKHGQNWQSYSKYLNQQYYNETDPTIHKLLSHTLSTYFTEQETKDRTLQGGYSLPVTMLDEYQEKKAWVSNTKDRLTHVLDKAKGLVKESDIDAESQIHGFDTPKDVDQLTQSVIKERVPALGMNMREPVERVNRNVLHAISSYIYASKDFDARVDMDPLIKSLIDVTVDTNPMAPRGTMTNRKGNVARKKTLEALYSQMILQETPDNVTNQRFFKKAVNAVRSVSAFRLLLDIPGGAVNYVQANINNMIEAFAGKHLNMRDYAKGDWLASKMIGQIVADYGKKSDFGFWTLMYQAFDFVQGEGVIDIQERSSLAAKLASFGKMMLLPRSVGELHAQSAIAIGILNHTEVQNSIDGKMYHVQEMYYKDGDVLKLKQGFDADDWNPSTGKKFLDLRDKIHVVNMDIHGNYAKFNQTEASRYSIGKIVENMKRWLATSIQRRFGRESPDFSTGEITEGYYNTFAKALYKIFVPLVQLKFDEAATYADAYWSNQRNRQNLIRTGAEIGMAALLFALYASSYGMGFNPFDNDRYKKLRQKNWLYNETLLVLIRSYNEQTAFIPVPPWGFQEMKRNVTDPLSLFKDTISNIAGVGQLGVYTSLYWMGMDSMKNDATYVHDNGAFLSHIGDYKIVRYLAKTFGYSGAMIDPATYIRTFENIQGRLK